ncbi:hypothetical protein [Pseudochelatococcus sp. G4_1912]|uniref:hypothetical protein n=1 Tax=Pseudochelatococcus sp. G4_1912 TaxID=3114288 RepID=UPI0039C75130
MSMVAGAYYGVTALVGAERHIDTAPPFDQSSVSHPRVAKVIAGTIFGVGFATVNSLAVGVIAAAAIGTGLLATNVAVWIGASGAVAAGVGEVGILLGALVSNVSLRILIARFSDTITDALDDFSNRSAVWLVNSLNWQSLLLNVRSVCGLVTAEELNKLDDVGLLSVSAGIIGRLSASEAIKLDSRVLRFLSEPEIQALKEKYKADILAVKHARIPAHIKGLNARAGQAEDISIEEFKALSLHDGQYLSGAAKDILLEYLLALPSVEAINGEEHVLRMLSEDQIAVIIEKHKQSLPSEKLNALAAPEQSVSVDEINELGFIDRKNLSFAVLNNLQHDEIEQLSGEVLNDLSIDAYENLDSDVINYLSEDKKGLGSLSAHVLNKLPEVTLVSLSSGIFQHLSSETLKNLESRVLNGSGLDLAKCLADEVKEKLSVKPIRWFGEISDVSTPNILTKIRGGERLYWISKRDGLIDGLFSRPDRFSSFSGDASYSI